MKSETLKKLRALAETAPRPWFPKRDPILEGKASDEIERDGSQFLVVEAADGHVYWIPRYGPIGKAVRECGVRVGDGLRIECLDDDVYLVVSAPDD